jgi:hypothetical protein
MNSEQFIIFKQALIQAVDQHLASGGTLSVGTFGSGQCLCPISCLVGKEGQNLGDKSSKALRELISNQMSFPVFDTEIWDFINGFDDGFVSRDTDSPMRLFGRAMRHKYRPIQDNNNEY